MGSIVTSVRLGTVRRDGNRYGKPRSGWFFRDEVAIGVRWAITPSDGSRCRQGEQVGGPRSLQKEEDEEEEERKKEEDEEEEDEEDEDEEGEAEEEGESITYGPVTIRDEKISAQMASPVYWRTRRACVDRFANDDCRPGTVGDDDDAFDPGRFDDYTQPLARPMQRRASHDTRVCVHD
jgi:hypothetical protein